MLVHSRNQLRIGAPLELRIEWPSKLERKIPLQLFVVGRVVRSGPSSFAVLFRHRQFRTRSKANRAQSLLRPGVDPSFGIQL
jgi:hypothetical protein